MDCNKKADEQMNGKYRGKHYFDSSPGSVLSKHFRKQRIAQIQIGSLTTKLKEIDGSEFL